MTDRVTDYARRVVAGDVPCGHLHRLACERHLRDMERSTGDSFPYRWDAEKAERVLRFAETLTIAEGDRPRHVRLIPSQVFDIGCTFGWVKKEDGYRRFRRRYKSMARQNGKTFENGIIGTYIAGFSGYKHGKLFTAATKKRQSRLAWEEMKKFINADPDLSALFEIKDYKSEIRATETECTVEALSMESGLDDGFRSIFASIDEIHQHRDNRIYKAIYNGTKALPETLVSMITTRGERLNSFAKEMDDYCIKVLEGLVTADDFFIDIYCLDKGDDIWDERNWVKSNPFLCTKPAMVEQMRKDAATARAMGGSDLRDFIIKSLNMWSMNADCQFISPENWQRSASERTLSDIVAAGYTRCTMGLDLSSGGDLTSVVLEFDTGGGTFYWWSHSFMPRARLDEHIETDLAPYDVWVQNGDLSLTGGAGDYMTDYRFIIGYIKDLVNRFGLTLDGIGYDPHNAAGILQDLDEFGCPVVMVTQSARNLNDATTAVRLLVKGQKIEHDRRNELLTWSMVNAVYVNNSFGEIKVDKKPHEKYSRIDPVDAAIDAHFVGMTTQPNDPEADVETVISQGLAGYLSAMQDDD